MMRGLLWFLLVAVAVVPKLAFPQRLVNEALSSFPSDTNQVEYSSAAKLRALPRYVILRQKYLSAPLAKLESSLSAQGSF